MYKYNIILPPKLFSILQMSYTVIKNLCVINFFSQKKMHSDRLTENKIETIGNHKINVFQPLIIICYIK